MVKWDVEGASSRDTKISDDGVLTVGWDERATTGDERVMVRATHHDFGSATAAVAIHHKIATEYDEYTIERGSYGIIRCNAPTLQVSWQLSGASTKTTMSAPVDTESGSMVTIDVYSGESAALVWIVLTPGAAGSEPLRVPIHLIGDRYYIWPDKCEVANRQTQRFGVSLDPDRIEWHVQDQLSAQTEITSDGVLMIGWDEPAGNIVRVVARHPERGSAYAEVTAIHQLATDVDMVGGERGTVLQIHANESLNNVTWSVHDAAYTRTPSVADDERGCMATLTIDPHETARSFRVMVSNVYTTIAVMVIVTNPAQPLAIVPEHPHVPNGATQQFGVIDEYTDLVWWIGGRSDHTLINETTGLAAVGWDEPAGTIPVRVTAGRYGRAETRLVVTHRLSVESTEIETGRGQWLYLRCNEPKSNVGWTIDTACASKIESIADDWYGCCASILVDAEEYASRIIISVSNGADTVQIHAVISETTPLIITQIGEVHSGRAYHYRVMSPDGVVPDRWMVAGQQPESQTVITTDGADGVLYVGIDESDGTPLTIRAIKAGYTDGTAISAVLHKFAFAPPAPVAIRGEESDVYVNEMVTRDDVRIAGADDMWCEVIRTEGSQIVTIRLITPVEEAASAVTLFATSADTGKTISTPVAIVDPPPPAIVIDGLDQVHTGDRYPYRVVSPEGLVPDQWIVEGSQAPHVNTKTAITEDGTLYVDIREPDGTPLTIRAVKAGYQDGTLISTANHVFAFEPFRPFATRGKDSMILVNEHINDDAVRISGAGITPLVWQQYSYPGAILLRTPSDEPASGCIMEVTSTTGVVASRDVPIYDPLSPDIGLTAPAGGTFAVRVKQPVDSERLTVSIPAQYDWIHDGPEPDPEDPNRSIHYWSVPEGTVSGLTVDVKISDTITEQVDYVPCTVI